MRDEVLVQRKRFLWLANIEGVMDEECSIYRERKRAWSNWADNDIEADAKPWMRFLEMVDLDVKVSKQCLEPLTETSGYWGIDKIRHYQWASRGLRYCKMLGIVACRNQDWEVAQVKLNQILLRRIANGRSLGMSVNPLEVADLQHLKVWPGITDFHKRGRMSYSLKFQPLSETDLPTGYAFDQYGLIVPAKFACQASKLVQAQSPGMPCLFAEEKVCASKSSLCKLPKSRVQDVSSVLPQLAWYLLFVSFISVIWMVVLYQVL